MKKLLLLLFIVMGSVSCNRDRIGYVVPVVNPVNAYDNRSVGVSANDFLSGSKYKAINVEICYATQHRLPGEVLDNAAAFLEKYCYKQAGIRFTERELPSQGAKLTVNELVNIEKQHRTKFEKAGLNNVDTLGLFILVTEGSFSENNVLGVAYKNTSIALFDGIISDNSGGLTQPGRVQLLSAVLHHELGHILGLVNLGTEPQSNHQDEAHGKHCNNKDCLMYYQVQTTDVINLLTGTAIPVLDANCEADLRANGGK